MPLTGDGGPKICCLLGPTELVLLFSLWLATTHASVEEDGVTLCLMSGGAAFSVSTLGWWRCTTFLGERETLSLPVRGNALVEGVGRGRRGSVGADADAAGASEASATAAGGGAAVEATTSIASSVGTTSSAGADAGAGIGAASRLGPSAARGLPIPEAAELFELVDALRAELPSRAAEPAAPCPGRVIEEAEARTPATTLDRTTLVGPGREAEVPVMTRRTVVVGAVVGRALPGGLTADAPATEVTGLAIVLGLTKVPAVFAAAAAPPIEFDPEADTGRAGPTLAIVPSPSLLVPVAGRLTIVGKPRTGSPVLTNGTRDVLATAPPAPCDPGGLMLRPAGTPPVPPPTRARTAAALPSAIGATGG